MRVFYSGLMSLLALLSNDYSLAETDVHISGFGTIGIVESDSEELGFRNDFSRNDAANKGEISFKALSNVGVQLDFDFNSDWDAVTQWVVREQDEQTLDSITSLAFLRYSPSANWSFRGGRTAIDLFHLSQYRDVGIAYTWAKVPTEVYGFSPSRSIDGLDAQYNTVINGINLSSKVFFGEFEADFSSTRNEPIEFDKMRGVRLIAETFDWSIQARYSIAEFRRDNIILAYIVDTIQSVEPLFPRAMEFASEVSLAQKEIVYSSVSGQYNLNNISMMGELTHINSDSRALETINNGYLSFIYHWNEHSFHLTGSFSDSQAYYFDEFVYDENALALFIDLVERQLNTLANNQITQSLGWRWDITESTALKVQLDHTRYKGLGSSLLGGSENITDRDDGNINTLFVNWSFSF